MIAIKNEVTEVSALIPADEIQVVIGRMLSSSLFVNSPRMCRLLKYLFDMLLVGDVQNISEYVIGIEVFERNPSTYSTHEDPIVRVQVGRLREKIKLFYATLDNAESRIELSIPVGSYLPVFKYKTPVYTVSKTHPQLVIQPFKCIFHHEEGKAFTQGLIEELAHQLFKSLGKRVLLRSIAMVGNGENDGRAIESLLGAKVDYLLEGSIQIDAELIKASVRLIDVSVGYVVWSEQFDRNILFAIACQEELALLICEALEVFFVATAPCRMLHSISDSC